MGLFRKKEPVSEEQHDKRVEVVVSKEANKKVVDMAQKANKTLNDLLEHNHFHIKIYVAAGGSPKKAKKGMGR